MRHFCLDMGVVSLPYDDISADRCINMTHGGQCLKRLIRSPCAICLQEAPLAIRRRLGHEFLSKIEGTRRIILLAGVDCFFPASQEILDFLAQFICILCRMIVEQGVDRRDAVGDEVLTCADLVSIVAAAELDGCVITPKADLMAQHCRDNGVQRTGACGA